MASGTKMAYNYYQNGKIGGFPQQSHTEMEVSNDMHLKMSKKIAQLTKVIYALNTKNDEHEAIVQSLREQHEEEIQKILNETKQKVSIYKEKLDEEADHRSTIANLQAQLNERQSHNVSLDEQFSRFKQQVAEKQEKERQDYTTRISGLSNDVLKAKKDFEEQIERFNSWKERLAAEHETRLAEISCKHQKELEDLRSFNRNQDDSWSKQCSVIEDKYKNRIDELKCQVSTTEETLKKNQEEFEVKLEKSQAFYEKELEALKKNQSKEYFEQVEELQKQIDRQKEEFGVTDRELRAQIDRLVRKLADTEDEMDKWKKNYTSLEEELSGKKSSTDDLSKQLKDLQDKLDKKNSELHNAETDLAGTKQHAADLVDELQKKSTLLGESEANNFQKEGLIKSLNETMDELNGKIIRLEAERSALQSQKQSLSSEQEQQLQNLRLALEDMTVEKETQKQRFERDVKSLKKDLEEKEKKMKEAMNSKIAEIERTHAVLIDKEKKLAEENLLSSKQELKNSHDLEMKKKEDEKNILKDEIEKITSSLTSKINTAEKEIERLSKLVTESESGLGAASGQLTSLKEAANQLQAEVDRVREELKASKITVVSLQTDLEKEKLLYNGKVQELEESFKIRQEELTIQIDAKWSETMKLESSKLREEISAYKEDEKKAALAQLAKLKDAEHEAMRLGFQKQIQHLKQEIEEYKDRLEKSKSMTDAEKQKWATELEGERAKLEEQLLQSSVDYQRRLEELEGRHAQRVAEVEADKDRKKMELETELKNKHIEELQGQIAAHRVAIETMTQLEDKKKTEALEALEAKHRENLAKLKSELQTEKESSLEALGKAHNSELQAARMQLDRAVEITRQKEKDHEIQVDELKTEIGHREQHIKNLQTQMKQLEQEISKLKKEIEAKIQEIKQTQKQAAQQLRVQEDKLAREKDNALSNLSTDHQRELEDLLNKFNRAQQMLKERISELKIELREAHERYQKRESRPEDLELIESLRGEVDEREARVKDLIEEKKFYQLELVNRETNFNKVFNTTPNVGVLNPFAKPKKKGDKAPNLSMGGSLQRLDPLPNSPLHDGKLNPTKPLPQPNFTKKFVK